MKQFATISLQRVAHDKTSLIPLDLNLQQIETNEDFLLQGTVFIKRADKLKL